MSLAPFQTPLNSGDPTMTRTIHGRTIALAQDPGIAEGQQVEITIKTVPTSERWGEGRRRCAGAFAEDWTEEDDRILAEIYQERKRDTRKEMLE
jgi:hypothetical protein